MIKQGSGKDTGSHGMGQLIPGHTQGSKDMAWSLVHEVTLGRTPQVSKQGADGVKEYLGESAASFVWLMTVYLEFHSR